MTVLVDSWAWIEYIQGSESGNIVKRYLESEEEIITCPINISEVYLKLLKDMPADAELVIDKILRYSFVAPFTVEIALAAARLKKQKKFGMADAIVLATAQANNAKVLTGDDDFKKEENVIYIGR
ncbi:type II toxin-antitoxin system VapC family toxin [Candidatus Woesearchaeota archaeon]|nr:type II toxin-antitoxin system VapC family toxin [Candidatus Woesearchaeota archaeon]